MCSLPGYRGAGSKVPLVDSALGHTVGGPSFFFFFLINVREKHRLAAFLYAPRLRIKPAT